MGQGPQGVGLHEPDAAALGQGAACKCRPLAVGDAAPRPMEVLVQQLLRPAGHGLLIPVGGEGQPVQQGAKRRVSVLGQTQHPLGPTAAYCRKGQRLSTLAALRQQGTGVLLPQGRQHGTSGRFLFVQRVFQPHPEHIGVHAALRLLFKGVEHGLETGEVVVTAGKADDGVHIQAGVAVGVEGGLLRRHVVAARTVPDLVGGAAALQFLPVHIRLRTAGCVRRPGGCGPTPYPPPAAAQRAQRPC